MSATTGFYPAFAEALSEVEGEVEGLPHTFACSTIGPAARMFERITINRQGFTGQPIDLGFLAECLVFYSKVRIIADAEIFRFLVRCCGPDELLELLEMGNLEIEYFENLTGIATVETNIGPLHELKTIDSNVLRYQQVSRKLFDELSGPSGKGANKLFNRFERHVDLSRYTREMLENSQLDLLDHSYVLSAAKSFISLVAPEYKPLEPLTFNIEPVLNGGTLRVSTNINFDAANAAYHEHVPKEQSSLSVAYILGHIADTRRDLMVGSRDRSEFALAPSRSLIAACKFGEIISAATRGTQVMDSFQEAIVDSLPDIKHVVNSGGRTFKDVVLLVQQGEKFKEWLRKQGGGEELRNSYCQDVARIDWAEKLPPKSLRWLIVTAGGIALGVVAGPVAGTAAGVALSAADSFLLDRVLKGWKPNQFIEGPLKQFLRIE